MVKIELANSWILLYEIFIRKKWVHIWELDLLVNDVWINFAMQSSTVFIFHTHIITKHLISLIIGDVSLRYKIFIFNWVEIIILANWLHVNNV